MCLKALLTATTAPMILARLCAMQIVFVVVNIMARVIDNVHPDNQPSMPYHEDDLYIDEKIQFGL